MCWQGCVTLSQQEELIFLVISLSHICQVLFQGTYKWKRMGRRQLGVFSFLSRLVPCGAFTQQLVDVHCTGLSWSPFRKAMARTLKKFSPYATSFYWARYSIGFLFFLLLPLIFWNHWLRHNTLHNKECIPSLSCELGPKVLIDDCMKDPGVPGPSSEYFLSKGDESWALPLLSSSAPSQTCSPWWCDSFTSQEKGLSAWFSHRKHTPGYYD